LPEAAEATKTTPKKGKLMHLKLHLDKGSTKRKGLAPCWKHPIEVP
jgi:hypothetical protein